MLSCNCQSLTGKCLSNITFTDNDIAKKAYGHDMISIPMLELCRGPIYKPLRLIFRTCCDQETFPLCWKKDNVIPIHKKLTNCE